MSTILAPHLSATHWPRKRLSRHSATLLGGLLASLISSGAFAAVSYTGSYTQNFDSLPAGTAWTNDSSLAGWSLFTKDNVAITTYKLDNGGSNGGSFYSYGTTGAADRALGALLSSGVYFGSPGAGAVGGYIALSLRNDTTASIDKITLKFNGEIWRNGGNTTLQGMTLEYGIGDTYAGVTTWTSAGDTFKWTAPGPTSVAGPVDGNGVGLVPNVGGDLSGLAWATGKTLWLRWVQTRISTGSSHGMAIDDLSITSTTGGGPVDTTPPALQSTTPVNNAAGVSTTGSLTLQFNETVQAGTGTFELRKGSTVVATLTATDTSKVTFSGANVTIKPGFELDGNTAYSLVPVNSPVKDVAGNNWVASTLTFTTGAQGAATKISAIQGSGDVSPLLGKPVTIDAIVTAYMPGLSGFYVQQADADQDGDPATSEGVLVYYNTTNPGVSEATIGKRVRFNAVVDEYNRLTELKNVTNFQVLGDGVLPAPVQLTLPISDYAQWERYEGMLVQISSAKSGGKLVVSDNFTLGRYGDVTLSPDEILPQFTDVSAPSQQGFADYVKTTQRSQIILDDNSTKSNPATVRGRNGQPLSASNTLRAGDGVSTIIGVLDQFYDTKAPPEAYQTSYRIQATQPVSFTGAERPTAADLQTAVGKASVKIASANVLNFFNQVGDTSTNTKDVFTTPLGNSIGIRGANTLDELKRQTDKVVANLSGMNADVYGLMEVQNNGFGATSAIKALTDALNANASKPAGAVYEYIKAPFNQGGGSTVAGAGTDAITVAIIYRSDRVTPVGAAAAPDVATYDAFTPNVGGARVPIAQTFSVPTSTGTEQFTVVVNHFKSKGSLLSTGGNQDIADGQGNNNPARLKTAQQLKAWLATDPTGTKTTNQILVGDFNAYAKEDPVTYLEANGFNKVTHGYSYSFDGLWGSLDHIFVTPTLVSKVGNAVKWAINAEEPTVLDYNAEFKSPEQVASFYAATAYRSSDHNPILLGLNFEAAAVNQPPVINGVPTAPTAATVGKPASLASIVVSDPESDPLTLSLVASNGDVLGVTDADAQQSGIQLKGTPQQINSQLSAATFVPKAEGAASVALSLNDGKNADVTGTYAFDVKAVVTPPGDGVKFDISPISGTNVQGELSGANCKLADPVKYVSAESLGITSMPTAGAKLPHGLMVLNAKGCDAGGQLTVKLTYSAALQAGAQIWKWGRTADNTTKHWYQLPASVQGGVVSFTLKDGGLGDDDLTVDGNIADPTAVVVPADGNPGTPVAAAPIPTLNIWGLLMLALSFLGVAPLVGRFHRKG